MRTPPPERSPELFEIRFLGTQDELKALQRLLRDADRPFDDPDGFHLLRAEHAIREATLVPCGPGEDSLTRQQIQTLEIELVAARVAAAAATRRDTSRTEYHAAFERLERARLAYDRTLGRIPDSAQEDSTP